MCNHVKKYVEDVIYYGPSALLMSRNQRHHNTGSVYGSTMLLQETNMWFNGHYSDHSTSKFFKIATFSSEMANYSFYLGI